VVTEGLRDGDKKIATGTTEFKESPRGFLGRDAQVFEKICTENAAERGGLGQLLSIRRAREVDLHVDADRRFEVGVDYRVSATGERRKNLGVDERLLVRSINACAAAQIEKGEMRWTGMSRSSRPTTLLPVVAFP